MYLILCKSDINSRRDLESSFEALREGRQHLFHRQGRGEVPLEPRDEPRPGHEPEVRAGADLLPNSPEELRQVDSLERLLLLSSKFLLNFSEILLVSSKF